MRPVSRTGSPVLGAVTTIVVLTPCFVTMIAMSVCTDDVPVVLVVDITKVNEVSLSVALHVDAVFFVFCGCVDERLVRFCRGGNAVLVPDISVTGASGSVHKHRR